MISVAMATYNGSKFVKEQLQSILDQTLPVDEVIICDDCSTDDTAEICRNFIEENGLDGWKFIENEENLGFCMNFLKAVDLCQGDLIFLSDQDDVWYNQKAEKMKGIMDRHPDFFVLSSSFDVIDENGEPLKNAKLRYYKPDFDNKYKEVTLNSLLGCTWVRGFSTCFRKSVKEFIKPIESKSFMGHDGLIHCIGAVMGKNIIINTPLVHYRFHHGNLSLQYLDRRKSVIGDRQKRINGVKECLATYSYLIGGALPLDGFDRECVKEMMYFESKRLKFLTSKKLHIWFSLFGDLNEYKRYYKSFWGGVRVWLGDFLYAYNIGGKK